MRIRVLSGGLVLAILAQLVGVGVRPAGFSAQRAILQVSPESLSF